MDRQGESSLPPYKHPGSYELIFEKYPHWTLTSYNIQGIYAQNGYKIDSWRIYVIKCLEYPLITGVDAYLTLVVDVSSLTEEELEHLEVTILGRDEERRGSVHHLDVDVCAVFEELLRHLHMITLTGHKERGAAILEIKYSAVPL